MKKDWTLILDRDGVINELLPGKYVSRWNEFVFKKGVLEGLAILKKYFKFIFIVTNQQGIGKKLMDESELAQIHHHMMEDIVEGGGRIDAIRYCPHLATDNCLCRKPNDGMIRDLYLNFEGMQQTEMILLGDSPSDFQLAGRIGAQCYGMRHEFNEKDDWNAFNLIEVNNFSEFVECLISQFNISQSNFTSKI